MPATRVDSVDTAAMMANALSFCAQKTGLAGREEARATLRAGNCSACEYLRYGLARGIAEYLGGVDDTVKAVYTYDPERAAGVDGAIASTGINLIAWVSRKSAALSSLVSLVSAGLAEERGRLGCPRADALCCALDVQVVDDSQVQSRTGYGALLRSLYVRPTEVWRR